MAGSYMHIAECDSEFAAARGGNGGFAPPSERDEGGGVPLIAARFRAVAAEVAMYTDTDSVRHPRQLPRSRGRVDSIAIREKS